MNQNRVSVIIPTLNRPAALRDAIKSIYRENDLVHEVIVIDQSSDSESELVAKDDWGGMIVRYYQVSFRGASKARNFGVSMAQGYFVFFMDDDAQLKGETLTTALNSLYAKRADVVFGRCVDETGAASVISFVDQGGFLSMAKHAGMFVESTMLCARELSLAHPFDEELGVGTFHGAEEALDLVLRLLGDNYILYYDPRIEIYHADPIKGYSGSDIRRVFAYRCGFASVCRKHRLHGKYYSRLLAVLVYIPYLALVDRRRVRYYLAEFIALIAGKVIP